jgi:hypothetical protein
LILIEKAQELATTAKEAIIEAEKCTEEKLLAAKNIIQGR